MEHLILKLKEIELEMTQYCSIDNKDGFLKEFVSWVYTQWSSNRYYDPFYGANENSTEPLSKRCLTYKEFIVARTGYEVTNYNSECTSIFYDERLQGLFGEACHKKLVKLIKKNKLKVPKKYKHFNPDVAAMIYSKCVHPYEDEELYKVCDSILDKFSETGSELEPYECYRTNFPSGDFDPDMSRFQNYTLTDFQKMAGIEL